MRLSEDALISKYSRDDILLHMAKTPIGGRLINKHGQLFALGFNAGGRPDGLWISQGSTWLTKAKELDNPKFPMCCYIYKMSLKDSARILRIGTEDDFIRFDNEFPSYWLNLDYFEVDFIDYLNGAHIHCLRKYKLDLSKLRKKAGETIRDTLITNNIIFDDADSAKKNCEFYNNVDIERFKYKDWAAVAEKYQGVIFETWETMHMRYLWYQSLDVASGCVWDTSAIEDITLLYKKIDNDTWEST